MNLQALMQRAGIWRAGELSTAAAVPTGFSALDAVLPGGGWPQTGVTEILAGTAGIGALRLVLPALAALSRQERWIVWVCPPYVPYSPALEQAGLDLRRLLIVDLPDNTAPARDEKLWAYEQALRFPDCGAALLWLDEAPPVQLRRLQLAAESGGTWALVFRPRRHAAGASPAVLRLGLETDGSRDPAAAAGSAVDITLIKARGAHRGRQCRVLL